MGSLLSHLCLLIYFLHHLGQVRDDLNSEEFSDVNNVITLTDNFSKAERSENLSGGAGTVDITGRNAYSMHLSNLSFQQRQDFLLFKILTLTYPLYLIFPRKTTKKQ